MSLTAIWKRRLELRSQTTTHWLITKISRSYTGDFSVVVFTPPHHACAVAVRYERFFEDIADFKFDVWEASPFNCVDCLNTARKYLALGMYWHVHRDLWAVHKCL